MLNIQESSRAGWELFAGRIWPAGRTLGNAGLRFWRALQGFRSTSPRRIQGLSFVFHKNSIVTWDYVRRCLSTL